MTHVLCNVIYLSISEGFPEKGATEQPLGHFKKQKAKTKVITLGSFQMSTYLVTFNTEQLLN